MWDMKKYKNMQKIFDSHERPQFSEGLKEEIHSKTKCPLFGKKSDTYSESMTDSKFKK